MESTTFKTMQSNLSDLIEKHIQNSEHLYTLDSTKLQQTKASYFKLIVASIIFGAIPGLLSAIDVLLHPEEQLTIPIIVVCISCINSILLSIIKYRNYDQSILEQSKSIEHLNQTILRLQEHKILLPSNSTQCQLQNTLYAVTHIINPSLHKTMESNTNACGKTMESVDIHIPDSQNALSTTEQHKANIQSDQNDKTELDVKHNKFNNKSNEKQYDSSSFQQTAFTNAELEYELARLNKLSLH